MKKLLKSKVCVTCEQCMDALTAKKSKHAAGIKNKKKIKKERNANVDLQTQIQTDTKT